MSTPRKLTRKTLTKLYLEPDMRDAIFHHAAAEGESASSWMRRVLRAAILRREKAADR